ncbi:MAG: flagellar hook-length control protein FliK [Marmoricola sp.]|nr:flagellar hook-length control protein FliK [Marmoricola sp.]
MRTTIELGARQGFTQAKIELSPPSLGTIRIQLQHSDDGLTARVITDHAATADTLSQGGDDLRRSLQQAGINVISLDIETRGEGSQQSQDPTPGPAPGYASSSNQTDGADDDGGQIEPTTVVLPGGTRVNVLA